MILQQLQDVHGIYRQAKVRVSWIIRLEDDETKFLPDIILWTQCYLHRGTCLNAMKWFCICSLLIPPKRFDIFPPITGGCSEGLGVV